MHSSLIVLIFFQWSYPINLGIPGVDDMNPQTCREWDILSACLVWQAYIGDDWEIFSRIINGTWTDTMRIAAGAGADINPSVAFDPVRSCFWCAWQKYTDTNWEIYVSSRAGYGAWTIPLRLTNNTINDASPSVCVVGNNVWIVWQRGNNIYSCYYNGTSWSSPIPITNDASSIMNDNPKVCRRNNHPFVVWTRDRDIYYSEYINNTWQIPQVIAPHSANDTLPEFAFIDYNDPYWPGVWVFWQSNRDGNYEIYRTGFDSMNVFYRVTYNNADDITPNPLCFFIVVREVVPPLVGFSTDRNGNFDIYSLMAIGMTGYDTIPVDINPAQDILPVTTYVNGWPCYLWIFWQTNRNTDWDIYGSFEDIYSDINEYNIANRGENKFRCFPSLVTSDCYVEYRITTQERVKLLIYDANGRMIKKVINGIQKSGNHYTRVRADNLNNGVYFIKLDTERYSAVEKIVVVKPNNK